MIMCALFNPEVFTALHHPRIFARIRDNELKFPKGESIYTLTEHFQKIIPIPMVRVGAK